MDAEKEKIVDGLIKIYTDNYARSERKFRDRLQTIDWSKEEKQLKLFLNISKAVMIVAYIGAIAAIIYFIIDGFKGNEDKILATLGWFFFLICTVSRSHRQMSVSYQSFKMLRDLLDTRIVR